MTARFFRAYTVADGGTSPIRVVASTADVARDGLIIDAGAWRLDNFRRNPALLWAHKYDQPPIGKVTHIESTGGNLIADLEFDRDDTFARSIESKYRNGFLNAVSVGWDTLEVKPGKSGGPPRITKAELLEISAVPVPSDPGALAIARSRYRASRAPGDDPAAIRSLESIREMLIAFELRQVLVRHQTKQTVRRVVREMIGGGR